MHPPVLNNILNGVYDEADGLRLESNSRIRMQRENLDFQNRYSDQDLKDLLNLSKSDSCADFMVRNPVTGNYILAEVKASKIEKAVAQLETTFDNVHGNYPVESARIYTSQDTFSLLTSPSGWDNYGLKKIGTDNNGKDVYQLVDIQY